MRVCVGVAQGRGGELRKRERVLRLVRRCVKLGKTAAVPVVAATGRARGALASASDLAVSLDQPLKYSKGTPLCAVKSVCVAICYRVYPRLVLVCMHVVGRAVAPMQQTWGSRLAPVFGWRVIVPVMVALALVLAANDQDGVPGSGGAGGDASDEGTARGAVARAAAASWAVVSGMYKYVTSPQTNQNLNIVRAKLSNVYDTLAFKWEEWKPKKRDVLPDDVSAVRRREIFRDIVFL